MNSQYSKLEAFIDSIGLRYFKGSELTYYWDAVHSGVKNHIPDESLWPNIVTTLIVVDKLRELSLSPLRITSSYRSPAYNKVLAGAASGSYHMQFRALDLIPTSTSPHHLHEVALRLRGTTLHYPNSNITFVWHGGIGAYPNFVHIDNRGYDADW